MNRASRIIPLCACHHFRELRDLFFRFSDDISLCSGEFCVEPVSVRDVVTNHV